jgi:hypothetical protein
MKGENLNRIIQSKHGYKGRSKKWKRRREKTYLAILEILNGKNIDFKNEHKDEK